MKRSDRYKGILDWFAKNVPVAQSELKFRNPYELIVAVILSAQCTDKRINMVTPPLLKRFPDPVSMSESSEEEIFKYIRSVTFPNNKSRHLLGMSKMLVEKFNSVVPEEPEELQKLPGVGRKTANVIASVIYNKPVIAVDTHVFRVARRIGLSSANDVLGVEEDLTSAIPSEQRAIAHHWLILHGRYICVARKPKCADCGIAAFCEYFEKLNSGNHILDSTNLNK